MSTATHITVGICTFRRIHIIDTLMTLARQNLPIDHSLHIVVADNDEEPSAQAVVAKAATDYGLDVAYVHAPAKNISIARNACLDHARGEYFAFIDDDELADPNWLSALIATQRETHAPVILGRMVAVYAPDAPKWLRVGDFHSTIPEWVDGKIITGYSNNVLMQLSHPALAGARFDERFGIFGGEDSDYFSNAYRRGATIEYAPLAITFEGVPKNRATLKWLRERRYRYGVTHADLLMQEKKPRLWNILLATGKMLACYGMMVICCLSPLGRRRWLLRGALHQGVARALLSA